MGVEIEVPFSNSNAKSPKKIISLAIYIFHVFLESLSRFNPRHEFIEKSIVDTIDNEIIM